MSLRRLLGLAGLLIAAIAARPASLAAQQADVIRGRVTGPDSLPIEGVAVTVTSIGGGVSRTARTDRNGRFTVTFPAGEGDYMVSYAAMGYAGRRFEVKRSADEEILVADARLSRMAAVLDPMKITAPRERVSRDALLAPDIGGSERTVSSAEVPAASMGDLAAMAASLPGVQLVPGQDGGADGFSVLGLGADQNNVTLNGMSFGGSNLPRDAAVATSLASSPYDVSRGGFSGAQFSIRTRGGSNFVTRGMSLNVDAPQLQWTDAAARALGQDYASASLGGMVAGPVVFDKAFYNLSWQLGRRSSDLASLTSTSPLGLRAAGVSADSAARLVSLLRGAGVPLGDPTRSNLGDNGSLFGSFDFAPPTSTSGQALNVTVNGSWGRQSPASSFATQLPGYGGDRTNWRGGLMARHSGYWKSLLVETSGGVSASRMWGTPYYAMPAGRVRVSSQFADGASGVQMLSFGGNPFLDATQSSGSAGVQSQLSWFSANNKHRLKLTSELRRDASTQEQDFNRWGTWSYQSLGDLAANAPSSFSRQLSARRTDASQLIAGFSLGDAWRRTSDLQLQYGVRLDANRFLTRPERNVEVERALGLRNDRVPNGLYLSPRVGFSWTYGTAAQIGGFEGAARGPRAVVRGGVGVFQSTPGTGSIAGALGNTGLANAAQQLTCIGDATPVPTWGEFLAHPDTIPTTCADGSTGSPFATSQPNVTLFARRFAAPRSVRSNLQWSGPVLRNHFTAQLEGVYSLNLHQQGMVDRNFDPTVRFTLPDEAGRPVFVPASSIVPGTGAVAAADARYFPEFARVSELRSDLRSESRQASLRLSPVTFSPTFTWSAAYVYTTVREQSRGFASTAGNPLAVEWARGTLDSRHQLQYSLAYDFFDAVRVSWFGAFRSGTPFTPLVGGDVNGDGWANDRAYVFDPASVADSTLRAGMQQLLAHGSSAARDCLHRQVGRLAGRNSCQGPWTSQATLSVSFNPARLRMPQRASLSFQVTNPLGAADLLLHGEDGQRGWGQSPSPDQSLLYVRGFDPGAKRFAYEVNQRFGATSPQLSAVRAPVTVTALFRFDVGPTRERQMLTQQLDRGRRHEGQKIPAQFLRAMYAAGGIPNPMAQILRQQDTLGLTGPQADSIAMLNRWYTVRVDSIWSPVTAYFAGLPDDYDQDEAWSRYRRARERTVDLLAGLAPRVKGVLTAEQRRKLPAFVASYLEPRYLASIRSGTNGFTGGMMFPGGGMMMPGGGGMRGAGGQDIVIIRQ